MADVENVHHVSPFFTTGRGGSERSVRLLMEGLRSHGVGGTVWAVEPRGGQRGDRGEGDDGQREDSREFDVRVFERSASAWPFGKHGDRGFGGLKKALWHLTDLFNPSAYRYLTEAFREERPDIVHTHSIEGFSPAAWLAAATADVPVVHTLRNHHLVCRRATMFKDGEACDDVCAGCFPYYRIRRGFSALVDGVIGASEYVLERHVELGLFGRAELRRVIYNPIRGAWRDESGRGSKEEAGTTFGYLGRLAEQKGVIELAEIFAKAPLSRATLKIGGRGAAKTERRLRYVVGAAQADIRLLGYVDTYEFLSSVDWLVVPSIGPEAMGRVVVEAYASGVPVITSGRGGLNELVEEGETGFKYDPLRPATLTRALERATETGSEEWERMSRACVRFANGFRSQRVAGAHVSFYRRLVGEGTPGD